MSRNDDSLKKLTAVFTGDPVIKKEIDPDVKAVKPLTIFLSEEDFEKFNAQIEGASVMSTTVPKMDTTTATTAIAKARISGGINFATVETPEGATPHRITISYPKDSGNGADPKPGQEKPWEGVLAIEGKVTGDNRYLMPGEIGHRDFPLPLRLQTASGEGHAGAVSVGRIDSITSIPADEFSHEGYNLELPEGSSVVWGEGILDGSENAKQAEQYLSNGAGISLDLPADKVALLDPDTLEEVDTSEMELFDLMMGGFVQGIGGDIAAATIVDIPAFAEATIRIVDGQALVAMGGIRVIAPVLTASAAGLAPMTPPKDWFYREEPNDPTPLTVTSDGEVYGHLALFNQCHTAFEHCELAPVSRSEYAYFHTGQIETDEGDFINVGRITVGGKGSAKGGHASIVLGTKGAMEHYEKTGCVGAYVRATDGKHGIWLSGAVRSDAPSERVRDMRANPPSGDWRMENGSRELVAVLSVPVGGFPVPRYEAHVVATGAAEEEVTALIATGYAPGVVPEFTGARRRTLVSLGRRRIELRDFPAATRKRMAKAGTARPDGSYPIASCEDAVNARRAIGRAAPGEQDAVKAHIRKREKALGCDNGKL
jgi:hypothetical protein